MSNFYVPGWVDDPAAVQAVLATLPTPLFASTPANAKDDIPSEVFLWHAYKKIHGSNPPAKNQGQVGSCVSFGTNTAIRATMAVEIAIGNEPEEFKDIAEEVTYGGSRVEVGGGRLRGDGSVGAWAADFVRKWGVVARGVYGAVDLSAYSESRCRQFGSSGVPAELETIAKQHPVTDVTQVRTWDEAKKALASGYGIAICSQQGFKMQRNANGICEASGSWAHCYPGDAWIAGPVYQRIRNVAVGDFIYDHNGDRRMVTEVLRRKYRGNLARISVRGGTPTTMTEDHPVLVYRRVHRKARTMVAAGVVERPDGDVFSGTGDRNFAPAYIQARHVRPGDYLVVPTANNFVEAEAESPRPGIEPSAELAWLFGFLIGDGFANAGHKIGLRIGRSKPWRRAIEALRQLTPSVTLKRNPTFVEIRAYNADLATWFKSQFYNANGDKIIPAWLMTWDRQSLIDGLMDSDGCRYKGRVIFTTTSESLALQVRQILVGLGYRSTFAHHKAGRSAFANARPQFVVEYRPAGTRGAMQLHDGCGLLPVTSVMLLPFDDEVYNLEVEETHSFIADGYATHNCMALIGYATIGGEECGFIENSWGPDAHTGPVGPGDPPTAGFYARASVVDKMLRQDDSWAFSKFQGFPARDLIPWII